jgi:hypothetical protein
LFQLNVVAPAKPVGAVKVIVVVGAPESTELGDMFETGGV